MTTGTVTLELVKDQKVWAGVHVGHTQGKVEGTHPWRVHCSAPHCEFVVHAKTEEKGYEFLDNHKCPYISGTRTYGWGITVIQLDKIWEKLDQRMDFIMSSDNAVEEKEVVKHQARGLSEALAIMMVPYFDTADKIAAEAMARYKKRKAGEQYDTPGLAQLRWKSESDKMPVVGHRDIDTSGLDDAVRQGIINAKGHFDAQQLAPLYGVTPSVVKAVWAQES